MPDLAGRGSVGGTLPAEVSLHAASNVYFGLNPMWVSTVILAVTYAVIMSEKINRAIIALIGASVMVLVGVFSQEEAIKGIDWNTIGLLTGMMILVSISRPIRLAMLVSRSRPSANAMIARTIATAITFPIARQPTTCAHAPGAGTDDGRGS